MRVRHRGSGIFRPSLLSLTVAGALGMSVFPALAQEAHVAVNDAAADIGTADAEAARLGSIAIGSNATANTVGNNYGTAVGAASSAQGYSSVAIGPMASTGTSAFGSLALGLYAVANESSVVSFGHGVGDSVYLPGSGQTITFTSEQTRRLIHVAAGVNATDAANLGQLHAMGSGFAGLLGGGAAFSAGQFVAPDYVIQGGTYGDVGSAFAAVDGQLSSLSARLSQLSGGIDTAQVQAIADAGDAATLSTATGYTDARESTVRSDMAAGDAATLSAANGYTDIRESALRIDMAAGNAATLSSANGYTDTRESAVRSDMAAGDVATLESAQDYADAGDATTLASANAYTDARFTELTGLSDDFNAFRGDVDRRINHLDRRIDTMAAMSGAYAGMAMNTAGLAGKNRVGVGIGAQGGKQAMAVGYQRVIGARASVSLGAAFGGGEKSVSAGAGFSW